MPRGYLSWLLVWGLCAPTLASATAPVTAASAPRLERAATSLRADLKALAQRPTRAVLERAEATTRAIDRLLDTCYHAPNLSRAAARPHARALRRVVLTLIGGAEPLLVVERDVLRYRPHVAETLSGAARALGRTKAATRWARRADAARGLTGSASPVARPPAAPPARP